MAGQGSLNDDTLPVEMTVSLTTGRAEDVSPKNLAALDEIVIPVEIHIPMTPALRAALARRR